MATVKYLDETGLGTVWTKVKGIVTPKADKVASATNGHLAGLNASGNLTDSGVVASNVALKDGSYSQMTVGTAEDLASTASVASEFTYRVTGGSTAVGKGGTALVDKIKGRTLVWNQKTNTIAYNSSVVTLDTSVTTEKKYNYISSTTSARFIYGVGHDVPAGHKVLIQLVFKDGISSGTFFRFKNGSDIYENIIYSIVQGEWAKVSVIRDNGFKYVTQSGFIASGDSVSGDYFSMPNNGGLSVFDLTLMFGAGNEPSTVAEFEALYPMPYYAYNAGELINNAADGLKTVGFNLLDEDTVFGAGAGITKTGSGWTGNCSAFMNMGSIWENKTGYTGQFCIYMQATGDSGSNLRPEFRFTDGTTQNGPSLLGTSVSGYVLSTSGKTVASIGFKYGSSRTVSVKQLCISLSDSSRNGTYEPHWEETAALNLGDIKVKSPNIWDEEWENGRINSSTGENSSGNGLRSKNYIPVSGSAGYYFTVGSYTGGTSVVIAQYDASKTFISAEEKTSLSFSYTVQSTCAYIRFTVPTSSAVTTYSSNVTICESGHGHDGKYYPYGALTIQGGLKSAGTVYDEISGGKYINRVGSVDMGDLTWAQNELPTSPNGYRASLLAGLQGVICSKYVTKKEGSSSNWTDPNILYYGHSNASYSLVVPNNSYASANDFKNAVTGSLLYYSLDTPEDFDLLTPIDTAIRNDPYGTEQRIPADTAGTVLAPFRADITYSTNIKEAVEHLDENFVSVASMTDFLTALGNQMNGTWSMIFKDGKYKFSFTPNPEEQATL